MNVRGERRRIWWALSTLGWGCLAACSLVENYDDPLGPRYSGEYSVEHDRPVDELLTVTFNVEFGRRVETAIEELEASSSLRGADILLLQEMDAEGVALIAQRLHYDYVYYPGSVHGGNDFGNAVLSVWPIIADAKLILPHRNTANGRIRIAVSATLDTPLGEVVVYSVHTATPFLGPRARRDQARAIEVDARRFSPPVLIGGDFNTIEQDGIEALAELYQGAGYSWATRGVGRTADSFLGGFVLDHVFVRGLAPLASGAQPSRASDHRPVWVSAIWATGP